MSSVQLDDYIHHSTSLMTTTNSNHVTIYTDIGGKQQMQIITFEMFVLLSGVPEIYDKIGRLSISKKTRYNMGCIYHCDNCKDNTCQMIDGDMPTIDYIPPLPKYLKYLTIYGTEIVELPELPEGLLKLNCNNNSQLVEIKNVPHSIRDFLLCNCNLKNLPNFPENATYINISNNWKLEKIPHIPDSAIFVYCSNCGLSKIPDLPSRLTHLICSYNELIVMPEFPLSLISADCSYNKLLKLPKLAHLDQLVDYIVKIII